MVQKTSIETYQSIINSGLISQKRMKVYEILYENPQGLTGTQVSEIFKEKHPSAKHSETIRNRITELRDMGVVVEMGVVECEFTKRKVLQFCTSDNLPSKLGKKLTLKEKVDEILEQVKFFGVGVKTILPEIEKEKLRNIYYQIENLKK
jgi:hypothetical protein